ncbi:MAG: serine/threonine-protein kinase [Planctomycetota bacterium]
MPEPQGNRPDQSLAERLRALFGASIDPRIELKGEPTTSDAPPPKSAAAPALPKNRYTARGEIARGGMGVILKVWDQDLKRALAMKLMLGQQTGAAAPAEESLRLRRFLEEAQITGQLEHPGIVPVHEIGLDQNGQLYFTMRLVKGRDLRAIFALVAQGKEDWTQTRALQVILKVCEAMAFAHDKGVVHRDLKPANIMVGRFGETYVMDWGLAKLIEERAGSDAPSSAQLTQSIIHTDRNQISPGLHLETLDGDVVGTPSYMAPEQAAGRTSAIGPRADIYAVGAMLYHLLTGQVPFVAEGESVSASALLQRVLAGPPPPVHALNPQVPAELSAICEKAMAREPSSRYATMLAMAQDIQAYLEGRVVRAYQVGAVAEFKKWMRRNRGMAAGLLAAITMAGGGLLGILYVQASAKNQLAAKNTELETKNVELRDTNTALAAAEQEARANADKAERSERDVRAQSYVANVTAADAALGSLEALRARWCLDECDASLRGWEWHHLRMRADTSARVIDRGSSAPS